MKFGEGYLIDQVSEDYDYVLIEDSYFEDLSASYIEILLANGYKEDSTSYNDTYYVLDNGVVYIEIIPYYSNGNVVEIYYEKTHKPVLTGMTLNPAELDIVKGSTYALTVNYEPVGAYNDVEWSTSDATIATVDENGLVTISDDAAVNTNVTITATAVTGLTASCKFNIIDNSVSGVKFEEENYDIKPGETIETSFYTLPYGVSDLLYTVSYSVSPEDAGITVDNTGKVTASSDAAIGTTVTLTLTYNDTLTATTTITVVGDAITHTLNQSFFGLTDGNADYKTHKVTTEDGASYEAQCASLYGIQIRSKNSNSGIIGHFDGKSCQSITIAFHNQTSSGKEVYIYASNTAFTIADMYKSANKVGTITNSNGKYTYTFTDSYSYIGFRSASGAIYMTSVDIIWG